MTRYREVDMATATSPLLTRSDNGADSFRLRDLTTLRTNGIQVRALIGRTRGAVKAPMLISLGANDRPNPCNGFGYGHQDGCPDENIGNIHGQRRNLVRWQTEPIEGDEGELVQIVGYLV